jgi:DMSO/TMAO reductase YedYZ molybdopterin-dependent catalytic subunit
MEKLERRAILKGAAAAGASGLTIMRLAGPAQAFPQADEEAVVVPWLDRPEPVPPANADILAHPLDWEKLDSRLTPNSEFFTVKHYNLPELSPVDWRLRVRGRVANPLTLSLSELRAEPQQAVEYALECSGNTSAPFAIGLIGNARWGGVPLRRVLKRARPRANAIEVVFWGADKGEVTIRDNTGVTGAGSTGMVQSDATGGLDLTVTEHFARSMSLADAMDPDNLLCLDMNSQPLPPDHGSPMRLIAPGWYGVANVKWLTRIELRSTRYQGRFMARDYVSIREERRNGRTTWTFSSVSHERLKSAPAKVTRVGSKYTVMGAAWGAPIERVEVQVDDAPWREARLARHVSRGITSHGQEFAWRFWTFPWGTPSAGEHSIRSRAHDAGGNVQPRPDDPFLTSRRTFWENNGWITRRVLVP